MAGTTTAMCVSFKTELLQAGHCFMASATTTGNVTSGNATITTLAAMTGIVVGMSVSGTGIPAGCYVASIASSTSITVSPLPTATNSSVTLTFGGDIFKMAIIKASPTGTYSSTTTNYSNITGNSDEVTSTNYTAGGAALTNVSPTNDGASIAWINFSPAPSWSPVSFSASACMIYNTTARVGVTSGTGAGRACSVHDFGGTQTVTNGTFTVLMPTANSSTAILRIA